ncbi:nucleic acid dioxygenase ALKBH1-like isoform X2 [Amphiura filiformis]|uniref:nucleic acid dioxygenase ALKBH1-like isoform X2 n=1 Tax=Amphiura filiformis TaxID=82378 RepID=UPI003B2256EE
MELSVERIHDVHNTQYVHGVRDGDLHNKGLYHNMTEGVVLQQVSLQENHKVSASVCQSYGLKPVKDWKAFSLHDVPGFIFIQDPFLHGYQRYWIKRCLKDFPQKPNVCNLDAHVTLKDDDCLWDMSQSHLRKPSGGKSLIQQLRWVTFGYHHNWDTKVYEEDHHSPFPGDLARMTELIADSFGYHQYKAEAAIVNFYHLDSTLGGHTDHSEFDLEMPIISYSFGQSAIFLVGGETKEQTPTAMFLHSGDIIMMGGPSRLAYHAVPRILPSADGNIPQCLQSIPELTSFGRAPSKEKTVDVLPDSINEDSECTVLGKRTDLSECCSVFKEDIKGGHEFHSSESNTETDTPSGKRCGNELEIDNPSAKVLCTEQSNFATRNVDLRDTKASEKGDIFDIDLDLRTLCCNENWNAFADYLKCSRINVSVRQVMRHGQGFLEKSPE